MVANDVLEATRPAPPARWNRALAGRIGAAAVLLLLIWFGFQGSHWLLPGEASSTDADAGSTEAAPSVVTLSAAKQASAGIRTTRVELRELQATATVPATIGYEESRHVELLAPVDSVIEQVLVKPGQQVKPGDRLAVLSSAEVGLARNEVERWQAEAKLAQTIHQWKQQTFHNLVELLATLAQRPDPEDVEQQFDTRPLGEHRDTIVSAYSRYRLAVTAVDRTAGLGERGVLPQRVVEERATDREVAAARFQAACERSKNEGQQELARAAAELDVAQRQLMVAQERLMLLLGPFAATSPADSAGQYEIRSPLAGRVEELTAVVSLRVSSGAGLFVVADTSQLWISARIQQRDWRALELSECTQLPFTTPAFPGETFEAAVRFIGATVSSATRTIPLVAEIDNAADRFRPGMFAWVSVPVGDQQRSIAVPASAIQRLEEDAFVFVEEQPGTFRRVDVTIGLETRDWVSIESGLRPGIEVVDQGAFFLKSELLLEAEE